jgi:hypothetical protein
MSSQVLGIHMRGTDKTFGGEKVPPQFYTPYIDRFVTSPAEVIWHVKLNVLTRHSFLIFGTPCYASPPQLPQAASRRYHVCGNRHHIVAGGAPFKVWREGREP